MQQQGVSDEQIIQNLRERGIEYRDIADALAQSRIKAAVEQPDREPGALYPGAPTPSADNPDAMEPSIMRQEPEMLPPAPGANTYQNQAPQGYNVQQPAETQAYGEYNQQNYASYGTSPDVTTEIAEQVVAERLGDLRKHLEKIVDMKTTFESKTEYLDERLKRIEKIIDTLQSSILRKVGDYVTNVDDIKRELIETQKTFAKLMPEIKKEADALKKAQHPEHHTQHQKRQ